MIKNMWPQNLKTVSAHFPYQRTLLDPVLFKRGQRYQSLILFMWAFICFNDNSQHFPREQYYYCNISYILLKSITSTIYSNISKFSDDLTENKTRLNSNRSFLELGSTITKEIWSGAWLVQLVLTTLCWRFALIYVHSHSTKRAETEAALR